MKYNKLPDIPHPPPSQGEMGGWAVPGGLMPRYPMRNHTTQETWYTGGGGWRGVEGVEAGGLGLEAGGQRTERGRRDRPQHVGTGEENWAGWQSLPRRPAPRGR